MTKILGCLAEITPALVVYKSEQLLLMPAELYIKSAKQLMENNDYRVPAVLWIYVGVYHDDESYTSGSGYTYGLRTFGYKEFEVNEWTGIEPDKIYDLLHLVAAQTIQYSPVLKDKTTLNDYFEDISNIGMSFKESRYINEVTCIDLSLPATPTYK